MEALRTTKLCKKRLVVLVYFNSNTKSSREGLISKRLEENEKGEETAHALYSAKDNAVSQAIPNGVVLFIISVWP